MENERNGWGKLFACFGRPIALICTFIIRSLSTCCVARLDKDAPEEKKEEGREEVGGCGRWGRVRKFGGQLQAGVQAHRDRGNATFYQPFAG